MKKYILLFLIFALPVIFCACGKTQKTTKQGFFFDTVVNITVNEKDLTYAEQAFGMCSDFEKIFSRTLEGSELWNINNKKVTSLSKNMKKVLDFSLSVSHISGGAFDVTVAPLCDLWNIKERTVPPTKEEINTALLSVGYENISLSPFDTGNSSIDLGAVAKGYAADSIADLFKGCGVSEAIIDLGGNVALIGEFTVGIRDPFNPDALFARITLKDKSAVTSGAYQRYFEHRGKRYHHIIDPRTGECAESGIASVTVVSPSSMQADALSTAIFVLGRDGISLCEKFPDTDALLITQNGEIITTDGFENKYSLELLNG